MIRVLRVPDCRWGHNIGIMRCSCSGYRLRAINVSCSTALHPTISMSYESIMVSHTHARGVCAIALVPGSSLTSYFAIRVAGSEPSLSVWYHRAGGGAWGARLIRDVRRRPQWRQIVAEGRNLRGAIWEHISRTCCSKWVSAERLKAQDLHSPPRPCDTVGSVVWECWAAMMREEGSSSSFWVVLSCLEGGLKRRELEQVSELEVY